MTTRSIRRLVAGTRILGASPRALAAALTMTVVSAGAAAGPPERSKRAVAVDESTVPDEIATDAAPGLRLSLAEVLDLAATQGADAVRAAIEAEQAAGEARAIGARPLQVSTTGGGNKSLGTSASGQTYDRMFAEAKLGKSFVIGTTAEVSGRTYAPTSRESSWHTVNASLTQPLLRGVRPEAVDGERRAARYTAEASAHTADAAVVDARAAAATAYWELVFAHADRAIRHASLVAAREQLRLTRSLLAGGQVPRSSLLASEQAISDRAEALAIADQDVVDKSLALRERVGLLAGPDDVVVFPDDVLRSGKGDPAIEMTGAPGQVPGLARVVDGSPVVAAAQAAVRAARARRIATTDRLLPALDLTISGEGVWNPTKNGGPGGNQSGNPGMDMMMKMLAAASPPATGPLPPHGISINATLTARYDLWGGDHGAAARERAAERRARLELAEAERKLRAQIAAARARVAVTARRVSLTAGAERRVTSIVEAEVTRFTQGTATVFDVLQRQGELEEARRRATRAAVDHRIATIELHRVLGDVRVGAAQ